MIYEKQGGCPAFLLQKEVRVLILRPMEMKDYQQVYEIREKQMVPMDYKMDYAMEELAAFA